ncbi:N-acetylneuraminate lyase-like [Oppia nitens]|uniref:N-acetylneuraminate lyase-like n=1 Tax=Oppia nitens TaxID=1686743 RepID=UPI0023D99840|nr:N-acetylneuraminate lyase-like [Oppia nitens]
MTLYKIIAPSQLVANYVCSKTNCLFRYKLASRCLSSSSSSQVPLSSSAALEAKKQKLFQFKGAMAPVFTPFDSKGEVDVQQIGGYVKYLVDIGVRGVYIVGTTGEGYSLTNDERLSLGKAWRQEITAQGVDLLDVVNVSSLCVKESIHLAQQSEANGSGAIAVLPPSYYKPNSVGELINFMKLIAQAAPNTPLIYYNIPPRVGKLNLNINEAIVEGVKQIPQLAAIKYSDDSIISLQLLQQQLSGQLFKIFLGFDETILRVLTGLPGYNAAIAPSFNLLGIAQTYNRYLQFIEQSETESASREQQIILEEFLKHKSTGNPILSMKLALNTSAQRWSFNVGYPRPPISFNYDFRHL